jgi:hypothetical protein
LKFQWNTNNGGKKAQNGIARHSFFNLIYDLRVDKFRCANFFWVATLGMSFIIDINLIAAKGRISS